MIARLCTTIRWIGTAMFVVVLIVWGVAVMRPRFTELDLSFLYSEGSHEIMLAADRGGFFINSSKVVSNRGSSDGMGYMTNDSSRPLGMYFVRATYHSDRSFKTPYRYSWNLQGNWWLPLALTLPFAARTTQLFIRRRRTRANPAVCQSCGYDLRAGHDKCPECGGESHVPAKSVVD